MKWVYIIFFGLILLLLSWDALFIPSNPQMPVSESHALVEECQNIYIEHLEELEDELEDIRLNLQGLDQDYETYHNAIQEAAWDLYNVDLEPYECPTDY